MTTKPKQITVTFTEDEARTLMIQASSRADWHMQFAEKQRSEGKDLWRRLKDRDLCAADSEKDAVNLLRASAKIGIVLHNGRVVA